MYVCVYDSELYVCIHKITYICVYVCTLNQLVTPGVLLTLASGLFVTPIGVEVHVT